MRRLLTITMVLAILGLSVVAFAANINVEAWGLGAGGDDVGTCQPDDLIVYVDWETQYSADKEGYVVTAVDLRQVGQCVGKRLDVTVTNAGHDNIGDGTGVITGSPFVVPIDEKPLASDVYDVHLVISEDN